MGVLGRLVKNPARVPVTLQRQDPVGTAPAPQHVIDVRSESEQATMPKIKKSGMYEDMAGNRFYYQQGAPITEAQERELTYAGPRTRRERERALPPPQNTAVPADEVETPEGGESEPETKDGEGDAPKAGAGDADAGDESE